VEAHHCHRCKSDSGLIPSIEGHTSVDELMTVSSLLNLKATAPLQGLQPGEGTTPKYFTINLIVEPARCLIHEFKERPTAGLSCSSRDHRF